MLEANAGLEPAANILNSTHDAPDNGTTQPEATALRENSTGTVNDEHSATATLGDRYGPFALRDNAAYTNAVTPSTLAIHVAAGSLVPSRSSDEHERELGRILGPPGGGTEPTGTMEGLRE